MANRSVCVLGDGQLGRMLKQAGEPLSISVFPVGADVDPATIPYQDSVITAEIERWPNTALTQQLALHPQFVNRDVFPIIADRLTQKQIFDSLSLPTAKWRPLQTKQDWPTLFESLGDLLIVKCRTGGYDGRGQWRLTAETASTLPDDLYQHAIVEQAIPFESELSLIGARNAKGETVFYPLINNFHQSGILKMSVALPCANSSLQQKSFQKQAQQMLTAIMQELNYVGVMAMECFVVGDTLLINELAPRVHNSGHWTQNGASISQFELHLRAILAMPMPVPVVFAPSVMINLIGTPLNMDWLSVDLAHLHWYDKAVRAGRKVGHINLTQCDKQTLADGVNQFIDLLPADYGDAIRFAQKCLT